MHRSAIEKAVLKRKAAARSVGAAMGTSEQTCANGAPQEVNGANGAAQDVNRADSRIGAILIAQGKLSSADIERILEFQNKREVRFGEAAVRLGLVSVDDLRSAIAAQYELPHLLPENTRVNSELVVAYEPFHRCAEQIRKLRTQLLMRWGNGSPRSRMLTIVSSSRGEGRSYITANLAVSFAQLGRRTLVVDADLRHSRQNEIFQVPNRIGLAAVLAGRADHRAVVAIPEFGPLSVLPAGGTPPNPAELLSRDTFPALLETLQPDFDVLLFDTPAAQTCADAQSVAFRAGSALVIARKDHTRVADTSRVIRDLGSAGAETLGTAFNSF